MCTRACVHICVPNTFCNHLLGTLYPVVTLCSRDGATSPVVCMRLLGMSAFMVAEIWARGLVSRDGNKKASTVADSMKSRGMFVLHATLFGRPSFQCSHVATLVHACLKCRSSIEFYNGLVHESKDPQYKTPLCVGWSTHPVNLDTNEVNTSIPPIPDGSEVEVLAVNGYESTVRDTATGHTYGLPVTWLVPKSVYTRLEPC